MTWLIDEFDEESLGDKLDEALKAIQIDSNEIVDIKYSTSFWKGVDRDDERFLTRYSALIIYKISDEKWAEFVKK